MRPSPLAGCMLVMSLSAISAACSSAANKALPGSDWPAYGGDKAGTKYTPLEQINRDTIKELQIAWRISAMPDALRVTYPDARGGKVRTRGLMAAAKPPGQAESPRMPTNRGRPAGEAGRTPPLSGM